MTKKRKSLTLKEREIMLVMRQEGHGIRAIGRMINRDPSIVSRELRRNRPCARLLPSFRKKSPFLQAHYAHELSKIRLRSRKRGKRKVRCINEAWGARLVQLLTEEGQSPEQASLTLKKCGIEWSTSSIYRFIKFQAPEFRKFLPRKGRAKRSRVSSLVKHSRSGKRNIRERPEAANNRMEVGHLEADTIHSTRHGKGGLLSVIDRYTRLKYFAILPDLTAATTRKALVQYLHTLPADFRRTLTLDNGSEFEDWRQYELIFPDLKVYFCDSYSSWQKGSVERSNQDMRRFFPKKTDFSAVDPMDIRLVNMQINRFPLKLLNGKTPTELFEELIA